MFGSGLTTYTSPFYTQTMMPPYDVPARQTYFGTFPVTQPYTQNISQTFDMPVSHTIQPIFVPTPFGVPVPQPIPIPVDRPCAVPVPQPVPVPVDRPCAVPVPYPVSVPQPVPVPQPYLVQEQVPVPYPVHVPVPVPVQAPQQEYYAPPSCPKIEYITEEPVRIVRRRRRRHRRCRSYSSAPAPLPPIIIPIPMQAPAPAPQQAPSYQVTEYIQDIYPPAQVFTEQVPVGYVLKNSAIEQPGIVQSQSNPGFILSPSTRVQPHLVQQLPNGQLVERPLSVGGGGIQNVIYQQPNVSSSNSGTVFSTPSFGA